jgi:hypothetical protein
MGSEVNMLHQLKCVVVKVSQHNYHLPLINVKSPYLLRKVYSRGCAN